ncbi:MAG TPA: ABC transporter permease [Thermoanaerobaculia bacterium]
MLKNYIKLAVKVLRRRKFFTFISLFGISLTLVVLMVATAILDSLLAPRAPESRFDRVLGVYTIGIYGKSGGMTGGPGFAFLDRYVRPMQQEPGAERVSIFTRARNAKMFHRGEKVETNLRRTDGNYWQILDHSFVEGEPFTEHDNQRANFVAVITDEMREKLYGGASAVGRTLEVDGQRFRIVGVVRAVPVTRFSAYSDVWVPVRTSKSRDYEKQNAGDFIALVLARSKSDMPNLQEAFQAKLQTFVPDDPRFNEPRAGLDRPFEAAARFFTGNAESPHRTAIFRGILITAALLFILLPTLNLVSINLSRITERASEIGVRKAFGASSRALVGQFVVENVVLTVIGGLIGFALAVAVIAYLNETKALANMTFDVNFRVFVYGMLLAAGFGIISGVYPAWRMARMQPVNALRGGAV